MNGKVILVLLLIAGVTLAMVAALSSSSTASFALLCGQPSELVPVTEACPVGTINTRTVDIANNLYKCCALG
jgi:hypothetical protein